MFILYELIIFMMWGEGRGGERADIAFYLKHEETISW